MAYVPGRGAVTAIQPMGSVGGIVTSPTVAVASSAAMAYHGYKRTQSVGWALLYSLLGPIGIPIALAQGFGKKKGS